MGKLFDISMKLTDDIIIFPGDPQLRISDTNSIKKGDVCNSWEITLGSHIGTHIDAPKHFIDNGLTIDKLPNEHFFGKAKVFEIKDKKAVDLEDIEGLPIQKDDIVLLKTSNSYLPETGEFYKEFTYVSPSAAKYLAEKKIKTLGFDYLSVEMYGSETFATHLNLLGNGIVIIEGLRLMDVEPGEYEIFAFPMNYACGNGSPVRAFLSK